MAKAPDLYCVDPEHHGERNTLQPVCAYCYQVILRRLGAANTTIQEMKADLEEQGKNLEELRRLLGSAAEALGE